jgi:hypothetical protein
MVFRVNSRFFAAQGPSMIKARSHYNDILIKSCYNKNGARAEGLGLGFTLVVA